MEFLRTLCLLSLGVSLVLFLLPDGSGKRACALVAGAGLVAVILSPLRGFSSDRAAEWLRRFAGEQGAVSESAETVQKEILQQRVAAYIEARAAELGGSIRAEATLSEENGSFLVTEVLLYGSRAALADFPEVMEKELGVPREDVKWMDS